MLRLYFDHNMPPAIASGLRRRDVDVLTASEDGSAIWADERILARAGELDRIVCTQDRDFFRIADDWLKRKLNFAGIIRLRARLLTTGQAIEQLELIAKVMTADELRNRVIKVPL